MTPSELTALREKEHRWQRRFLDLNAPAGLDRVIARLDELASATRPANWESLRYWSETPSVSRVGARAGVGYEEELSASDGMDYLLSQAVPVCRLMGPRLAVFCRVMGPGLLQHEGATGAEA
jgi:hypothetical protein